VSLKNTLNMSVDNCHVYLVDYPVSCNHLVKIVKVYMLPFCGEIKMNIIDCPCNKGNCTVCEQFCMSFVHVHMIDTQYTGYKI